MEVPPKTGGWLGRASTGRPYGSGERTDFKLFAGRSHWIIAQEGWEEVAGSIADWLRQLPGART